MKRRTWSDADIARWNNETLVISYPEPPRSILLVHEGCEQQAPWEHRLMQGAKIRVPMCRCMERLQERYDDLPLLMTT